MSHPIRANRSQRLLLPPDIDDWVGPLDPARFVAEFVEALDLDALGFRMSVGTDGRPHYAPELLLGVWLYGWMTRTRSSRELERALRERVPFMWLAGRETPDHNTLWRFFSHNKKAFPGLFRRLVRAAVKLNLVSFALHALDGTKIAAACSNDSAHHRKTLLERLAELDAVIAASMTEIEATEKQAEGQPAIEMPAELKDQQERRQLIVKVLAEMDEAGVHHLSPHEPEARMQKTRDGFELGYNAQIVVDHESDLIVAQDVVQDQTDQRQLVPMLDETTASVMRRADETVADKGYSSGAQMIEVERRHLRVLVPAPDDTSEKGAFSKANFVYSAEGNFYVCPLGVVLPHSRSGNASSGKAAYEMYRCGNQTCPERASCTRDVLGRSIKRFDGETELKVQAAKLQSPANRVLWSLRKEIVEHIFGIMKQAQGFRRFTVWGLDGAKAQWAILCTATNLLKIVPMLVAAGLRGAALASV
jgi:transposase